MELRTRLPQTSEDVDEVEQAVAEIEADPEQGLSPVQDAVLGNDIGVVPIIVSVALYMRRRG
jgi:hypothetical protein